MIHTLKYPYKKPKTLSKLTLENVTLVSLGDVETDFFLHLTVLFIDLLFIENVKYISGNNKIILHINKIYAILQQIEGKFL